MPIARKWLDFRRNTVEEVPEGPGIYEFGQSTREGSFRTVYIGHSKDLKRRLKDHLRSERFREIEGFRYREVSSQREAQRLEREHLEKARRPLPLMNRRYMEFVSEFEDQAEAAEKRQDESETTSEQPSVFICYSHENKEALEEVKVHLRPLIRQGTIDLWEDTQIHSGDKWLEEIREALGEAKVAILLVSPYFMDSDFVMEKEVPKILEDAQSEGTLVLPLIVNHSRFERESKLSAFQAVNSPDEPLKAMSEVGRAGTLDSLVERIETFVEEE